MNDKKLIYDEGALQDKGKLLPPKEDDKKKKENEELRKVFKGDKK